MNRTRTSTLDAFGLRDQRNRIYPTMEGSDGSTLSLDFTTMSSLDSRFTFTRAAASNSGTTTYINSSGLVTTATTNQPRFDYDPTTLQPRGLLIEGSATNYALLSESFGASNWTVAGLSGGVVTSTTQTNPAGILSSIRMVEDSGFSSHNVYSPIGGLTSGQQYTFSVFVKSDGTRSLVGIRITLGGAATDYSVIFDLSNGTTGTPYTNGSPGTVTPQAVQYPGGWWRLSVTMNAPAATTLMYIYNATTKTASAGVQAYTGNGVNGAYIWGAQVELGSGASSYIGTGASTATRALDSCSIAASPSWFSTTSGTFLVQWRRGDFGSGTERTALGSDYVAGRWLGLLTNSASNSVNLSWWNGLITRTTGSTTNKASYTYGPTTGSGTTLQLPVRLVVNNSAVVSGTFGNGTTNGADVPNPSNISNFVVGANAAGSPYVTASRDFLNNCVVSIKYWPTILPDTTLQSLTS